MDNILGKTTDELMLETVEENRDAVLSLARQAKHRIHIFSQQLDADLYDNEEFEQLAFNLANSHRSSEIRILVQDAILAVQHSHRLVYLSQKLTSSVFIRKPAEKYKDLPQAYITVDGMGMLYRVQGNTRNYKAIVNFMSPQRTSELDTNFNEIWEHSEVDPQLRRLFV